ncbi:hypothetical protein ACHAQA_009255 [Verticillium albo-atrum]
MASDEEPAVPHPEDHEDRITYPAWSHAYPYGIPSNYNMAHHVDEAVPEYYLEEYLSVEFYTEPPEDIKAVFSTRYREFEPRKAKDVFPRRELKLWDAQKIQNTANSIRKKFWASMRSMPQPEVWDDLYDYFDTHDIYFEGALNLWNLLVHLHNENKSLLADFQRTMTCEVSVWADEWAKEPGHKEQLLAWDSKKTIDVLNILSTEELEEIRSVDHVELSVVRASLIHCRDQLRGVAEALPRPYPGNSLQSNWSQVNRWLLQQSTEMTPSAPTLPASVPTIPASAPTLHASLAMLPTSLPMLPASAPTFYASLAMLPPSVPALPPQPPGALPSAHASTGGCEDLGRMRADKGTQISPKAYHGNGVFDPTGVN